MTQRILILYWIALSTLLIGSVAMHIRLTRVEQQQHDIFNIVRNNTDSIVSHNQVLDTHTQALKVLVGKQLTAEKGE